MFKKKNGESPQQAGRSYERYVAELIGGEVVKGSGSLWYTSMDINSKNILWSAKYTEKNSYSLSAGVIQEIIAATSGVGGTGANVIPALCLGIDGEDLAVMRLSDLRSLLLDEEKLFQPSKREIKESKAKIPRILRSQH